MIAFFSTVFLLIHFYSPLFQKKKKNMIVKKIIKEDLTA